MLRQIFIGKVFTVSVYLCFTVSSAYTDSLHATEVPARLCVSAPRTDWTRPPLHLRPDPVSGDTVGHQVCQEYLYHIPTHGELCVMRVTLYKYPTGWEIIKCHLCGLILFIIHHATYLPQIRGNTDRDVFFLYTPAPRYYGY